jgi:hypothetical protein
MPHRKWLYDMDSLNPGISMSQDFSGYLDNITPDSDVSQQFDNTLSFPWSCEGGGCNCTSIDTMSGIQSSIRTNSLPSSTNSCLSAEGPSYIDYSLPSPTNTEAIAIQQIKEGLCPLATGATNECVPHLCGTNPPCQAFWSVPEIEECGEAPCLIKPEDQQQSNPSRRGSHSGSATLQVRNPSSPLKKMRRTSGDRSSTRSSKSLSDSEPQRLDRRSDKLATINSQPSPRHDKKPKSKPPTDPKQAHSLVEKRYRENLNAKISELHCVLASAPDGSPGPADATQSRKSEVLQTAIDYVNQSQLEMRHMGNDINRLNVRVRQLEKLVKCEDCSLLKGMEGMRGLGGGERGGVGGINAVGAEFGLAATSAG